jgi:internalin A
VSMTISTDQEDIKQTASAKAPVREIRFPDDRSLGKLWIRDEKYTRHIDGFHYHTSDMEWESSGQARGTVKIPTGKVVWLMVARDAVHDLSPLAKLGPNDLYSLSLAWMPAGDGVMQHVAHLSGLRKLDLCETQIGDRGVAYVGQLKSLEYLSLPRNVTDKGMSAVGKLPHLKGLYFKTNKVSNDGLRVLSKMGTLEELELGGDSINDDGLKHIARLPKLDYLMLWGNFTGSGFKHLRGLSTLRIVDLFRMDTIQDAALEHLAALPALENLSLFDNRNISDQGMAFLEKSSSLKQLDIRKTLVTERGANSLSKITTLEYLYPPEASLTDAALESIGRLSNLKGLDVTLRQSIDIRQYDAFYTSKGLAALDGLNKLEELSVSGPAISNESIKHIIKHTQLKKLAITSSQLAETGLQELEKLQSLERLDLSFNGITLGGLAVLNKLPKLKDISALCLMDDGRPLDIGGCKELERLYFSMAKGSSLKDEDLRCLNNLHKLRELQTGMSADSTVSDAGLLHLSGLTELTIVVTGGKNVTDAGLTHLANLTKLSFLSVLGDISGDGLQNLNGLESLRVLKISSLQNINQAAVDKFTKTMPGEVQVTITYH